MRTVKAMLIIIVSVILLVASLILYTSLTDMKPREQETLSISNNQLKEIPTGERISITTYNIGYAGLGKSQDFFADGGKKSRAGSKEEVEQNLEGIIRAIDNTDPDIIFLQEVDENSSRSFKIDQVEKMKSSYPNYGYVYGINYKVPWVPVPVKNPMGNVLSGIMTMSKYNIASAARFQLPGEESWPVRLFELDRCFTEVRIKTSNGKEAVFINLHLSAFDKGGIIRLQQLEYLKKYLEWEHSKGNYVIAGGDWNHNLPGTDPHMFESDEEWPFWLKNIPDNYKVEGFVWACDPLVPTVRTLEKSYEDGYNFRAVIDGFLITENVEVLSIEGFETGFTYTDHNPVNLTFSLK